MKSFYLTFKNVETGAFDAVECGGEAWQFESTAIASQAGYLLIGDNVTDEAEWRIVRSDGVLMRSYARRCPGICRPAEWSISNHVQEVDFR